ncbi:FAD synthetase family protein [Polaromonas sp. C04]|uniref:FAD synthetase family protein n=1 Tax=Polaromonas sp. C04 TaxID=1945857 RepID=UPI0009879CA5|nr:FAD synthetase family protein [Polaromonas sp. C04]OOG50381.1 hypothetical protein B0E49_16610 [Polaromonas sp. C04]
MQRLDATGPALPHGSVVSIGMFDGVHRGHRGVLERLGEQGRRFGLPTVVLTFDPHPRAVLNSSAAPRMLSPLADRLELLAATGDVDHCLVLPFDRRRSEEPVESFVQDTLLGRLRMRALVVGENFACGRGRSGDVRRMRALGERQGFEVHAIALHSVPVIDQLGPCSSTATRRLIHSGDVRAASLLLDRPHELTCAVEAVSAMPIMALDARVPDDMCAPPADHYAGAVRNRRSGAGWTPAVLHMREDARTHRRLVRIENALAAECGDLISLRFFDKAAPSERFA